MDWFLLKQDKAGLGKPRQSTGTVKMSQAVRPKGKNGQPSEIQNRCIRFSRLCREDPPGLVPDILWSILDDILKVTLQMGIFYQGTPQDGGFSFGFLSNHLKKGEASKKHIEMVTKRGNHGSPRHQTNT